MKQLSTQEVQILALLLQKKYKINIQYLGFDFKKDMDSWLIEFSNENHNKRERFFYYTGIGHRIIKTLNKYPKPLHICKHQTSHCKKRLSDFSKKSNNRFVSDIYAIDPEIAGILKSLILDSEARNESFNEWCANFGYNNDSISHFNIYQECCKIAEQFYSFFPKDTINEFKVILEDY